MFFTICAKKLSPMTLKFLLLTGLAMVLAGCAGRPPALPTAAPAQNGLIEAELDRIGPALQAYIDSGKVGGIYAVIARNGYISYEQTFGWADIERRRRLERDAVFRIFSMTKPVVAAGALKLVVSKVSGSSVTVNKYVRAGESVTGSFEFEQPTAAELERRRKLS